MRRPRQEFRRSVKRRWIPNLFWLTLSGFMALLFILFITRHRVRPTSRSMLFKRSYMQDKTLESLNATEEMVNPNSISRKLNDQIQLAKAYVVIAKENNNLQFAWELSAQIRNSQILLSNPALTRSPLTLRESNTAIRDMALLLFQAQQYHYDSATMIMRLKARIQDLEEQTSLVTERSSKYGQIAAEEVPKSLFCLGVGLTTEWFKQSKLQQKVSDNILATSVVVNSTSLNSKNPDRIVFHLVTDEVNYAAMSAWFTMNDFHGVTVNVQKFEDFTWLNASYVPVLKQLQDSNTKSYYFSGSNDGGKTPIKFRNPKYLSMLNHIRFYIPEVFPDLKKVVFLDDDVIVQKDLSEWRKRNVTGIYHYWQEKNIDRTLWKLGTLPPGLLTFYGLTEALDPTWHVLGLGYTNVDSQG
ncbi:hypothetical protein M8C21_021867 [Ambrosia artemisiifolia]|uniref:Hexosyltransferase n=1 Tax=Ambrosia artemisiifolia TaxID=4212 RepID=A0AAD5CN92_AMBAR|nr:hypothetical protein M8C21_021867 [Ambrosia artemisiifolia]